MKKFIVFLPVVLLAACAVPTTDPEPAPTVTITQEAPAVSDPIPETTQDAEFFYALFDLIWQDMSEIDRMDICSAYSILGSDQAFDAFKDGFGEGDIKKEWFDTAILMNCSQAG